MSNIEEKTIIEGTFNDASIFVKIGGVIAGITLIYSIWWSSNVGNTISEGISYGYFTPFLLIGLPALIISAILYYYAGKCSIVVTNKRVYGTAAFGKQVDLPFDLISAVSKTSMFSAIAVSTSSGVIKFTMLNNSDEVFNAISNQLKERQNKNTSMQTPTITTIKQEIPQSNADELRKYKDLLDSGVITQDEFEAKKKQLLGL